MQKTPAWLGDAVQFCHSLHKFLLFLPPIVNIYSVRGFDVFAKQKIWMSKGPGTMTTHAESIHLDLQRGLDRTFTTHTTLNTEQNQLAIKVSADNKYYRNASG